MYRSRLSTIERKRNNRTAFLLILSTITILVILGFSGIPLLSKLAVFSEKFRTGGNATNEDFIAPPPPILNAPFQATNSAEFTLRGTAEPTSLVYLSQNSIDPISTTTSSDGTFEFPLLNLRDGDNTFVAVAVDKANNKSRNSASISIFFSKAPPKLEIESPKNDQHFYGSNARVEIRGKTDPTARVTVNDRLMIVNQNGDFSTMYTPNPNDNKLTFVATDQAGNQTKKEVPIFYSP